MSLSEFRRGTSSGAWEVTQNYPFGNHIYTGADFKSAYCYRYKYTNPYNYAVKINGIGVHVGVGVGSLYTTLNSSKFTYTTLNGTSYQMRVCVNNTYYSNYATISNVCTVKSVGNTSRTGYFYAPTLQTIPIYNSPEIPAYGTAYLYFSKNSGDGCMCWYDDVDIWSNEGPVQVYVSSVAISPTSQYLCTVENAGNVPTSANFTAQVSPYNATNKSINWYSTNGYIAAVDNGVVIPYTPGTCQIVAAAMENGNIDARATVNVYGNPEILDLSVVDAYGDSKIFNGYAYFTTTWNTEYRKIDADSYTNAVALYSTDGKMIESLMNIKTNVARFYTSPSKILNGYDNKPVRVRVTRTHSTTKVSTYKEQEITIRYTPIAQVKDLLPTKLGNATSEDNYTISWKTPTGHNGIYSRYHVYLVDTVTGEKINICGTNNYTEDTKVTFIPNKLNLVPNHNYDLTIIPYFWENVEYVNDKAILTVHNYLTYRYLPRTAPNIVSPTGNGKWYGEKYKVLIKMPEDENYNNLNKSQQLAYKYNNLVIKLNSKTYSLTNNPSYFSKTITNLKHGDYILFSPPSGATVSNNNLECYVKFGDSLSTESKHSNRSFTINTQLPIFSFKKDEEILNDAYMKLVETINNMTEFVIPNVAKITTESQKHKFIYATNYSVLLSKLNEIYTYIAQFSSGGNYYKSETLTSTQTSEYVGTIIYANGLAQKVATEITNTLTK